MTVYAKGAKPHDLDAACGGEVLGRVKSFLKDPDPFHPDGAGMLGRENKQDYSAKGSPAKRQGDTKAKTPIKPRS